MYSFEFIPLEDLLNVKTENSLVIIRMFESPSHYTPYCIQEKLRERGSTFSVFGAEPLACIIAYEKILMQRLQIFSKVRYPVPSALINLLSGRC
jgi:hypothetical protein